MNAHNSSPTTYVAAFGVSALAIAVITALGTSHGSDFSPLTLARGLITRSTAAIDRSAPAPVRVSAASRPTAGLIENSGGVAATREFPLVALTMSPASTLVEPGTSTRVTVLGELSDGLREPIGADALELSSADPAASIDSNGLVTVAESAPAGMAIRLNARDSASGLTASTVLTVSRGATLTSVDVSPSAVALIPGSTTQLTVSGTYSDGSIRPLPSNAVYFSVSNPTIASIDANGRVTVAATVPAGASTTVAAVDRASSALAPTAHAAAVSAASASSVGPPTPTSAAAAASTAQSNAQCSLIRPFYWEVGNADTSLASGSVTPANESPVLATTKLSIASASKWLYGMYVVQQRGGASQLTNEDVSFLTFQSGYTYMTDSTTSATCTAPASGTDSINYCLTLPSKSPGKTFASYNASTAGVFDYDSGHQENHAGQFQPEISGVSTSQLGTVIASGLASTQVSLRYTEPLLAGGVYASASDYTPILRAVLSGKLAMLGALGTHAVCAWRGHGCNAAASPIYTQHWHYSISHWVEDDPKLGDGAFSSPGAFGFYPWIEANKQYYGVIARYTPTGNGLQNGLQSSLCGHAIRAAWESGKPQ